MKGIVAATMLTLALTGCGGDDGPSTDEQREALEEYVAEVQPIRLGINELLDRADPILSAYKEGRLGAAEAQRRMEAIERRVAEYAVDIAALEPVPAEVRAEHDLYAHVFVLQDTYLSALVEALPDREFDELPDVQDDQRAAIIEWRTRLHVLADALGASLPGNLEIAGRGEIVPSPVGD